MKRLQIPFLLTLLMSMMGIEAIAHDIEVANSDGVTIYYTWVNNKTELSVSYRGSSYSSYQAEYSGSVVIPETVMYNGNAYSVTSIDNGAFYRCSGLTSVTIPNSVTSIGVGAFAECSGLTSVNISDVAAWCNISFVDNYSNPINYAHHLYLNGQEIHSLIIPNSVTSISHMAFLGCSGLTSVTISNSVTKIGMGTFENCSSLTSVTIPNSVTSIGSHAFYGCSCLQSVVVGNGVTSIPANAFGTGSNIKSFTVGPSVLSINSDAFRYNYNTYRPIKTIWLTNTPPNGYTYAAGSINYVPNDQYSLSNKTVYTSLFEADGLMYVSVNPSDCMAIDCDKIGELDVPESVAYNGSTYTVTSIGSYAFYKCSGLTNVTIPNSLTTIGGAAFSGCSGLTSATIPNSVTSIGGGAFSGCSGLKSVNIGNSVTSIGDYAFHNCSGLTNVTIPNSVTSIVVNAFSGCTGLTNIEFHCKDIGSWFSGLTSIKEVKIGNEVQRIGGSAFSGCSGLTNMTIPHSVTSIGGSAFSECSGLTNMTIPNSVTSIGDGAFQGCTGLTSVQFQDGEETLTFFNNVFSSCPIESIYVGRNLACDKSINYVPFNSYLKTITWGNSVTSIGYAVFGYCSGLTSVTIPNSVTSIGDYAFYKCSGLQSVVVGNGVTSIPDYVFDTGNSLKTLTIGTGVLSISSDAFYNKRPIKTIWLTNTPPSGYTNAAGTINYVANDLYTSLNNKTVYPFLSSLFEVDGVKYVPVSPSERTCDAIDCLYDERAENVNIGETVSFKGVEMTVQRVHQYACYNNPYIKKVELDLNGNVEDFAFYKNENLNTVEVGSHVANIGAGVFQDCVALTNALLKNKGDIGKQAFQYCTSLVSSTIKNEGYISAQAFQDCAAMTTATLGEAVTGIGNEAFRGCSSLQSIVIPNAVTSLGQYTFSGCSQMTSVKMGTGVKTISTYAFADCSALTSMQIGSKVETIETNVFNNCKVLPEIEIPKSVKTINNYVFRGCSGLKDVVIADRDTILSLGSNGSSPLFSDCPLDSVYIGGNINYNTSSNYGYSPFYRNTSLRTVVITDKETEISENEFYGCTNLQDVKIGDGVESFGDWAFSGCSSLKHFAFGMSVERIGKEAFSDCTAMESIASRSPEPPVCGSQALDDINKWNCVLTVPAGNKAAYMAADQWKEFFFVEEGEAVNKFVTVSIEKSEGGKVLVNDKEETEVSLKRGSDVTLKFIADEGHSLAQVTVNGEDVTGQVTDGSYTLKEVFADVTVKATFSVNSYKLIYLVDGEEYKTLDVDYGTAITPEEIPEKEGYTFSGWSEIPETMPAHDVTVTGTFSINSYTLTYMIDEVVYKQVTYEYGASITPEPAPQGDYKSFEWVGVPETMPAHDVTVTAVYETGIDEVMIALAADGTSALPGVRIYAPNGKRLDKLQKGINIVVMKDGTTRKVVVK